jgi:selenide,water dikinase
MASLSEIPSLRLTSMTDCGGCAAKLGADMLSEALAGLGAETAPDELIAGLHPPDDAAAYRVSDDLAVIGTVDFFPPLVDDAWTFGQIAAANAMSDVFAMGGRVLFALSIAAFPEELPPDVLAEVFGGASDTVRQAGGTLAGGHTIRDPEPKYGLAVIGAAHPDRLLRKGGAAPGDSLVVTKPLGTGLIVSGSRQGRVGPKVMATVIDSMRRLNRDASQILVRNGVTAATDVTGFGLLGHGLEMARASGVRLAFTADALPALPGAIQLAVDGVETDGAAHNRRFVADDLAVDPGVPAELVTLAHDPQTSGGLLAAIPAAGVETTLRELDAGGVEVWEIGRVEEGSGVSLA